MPWDASDAVKHSRHAKGKEKKWARIANGVLRETGDDAKAIRIANGAVHPGKKKK